MSTYSGRQFEGARRVHRQSLRDEAKARQATYDAFTLSERVQRLRDRRVFPSKEIARLILSVPGMAEQITADGGAWR